MCLNAARASLYVFALLILQAVLFIKAENAMTEVPVCCSSFAWPAPDCPVPDLAQEGYCWPGGASGWEKAKTVMEGHHLTGDHPAAETNP